LASRKDELHVFDNAAEGKNKSASAIYFFYNGAWRRVGLPASTDVGTNVVFNPGTGVIIRKAITIDGSTAVWQNPPNY
jgi:uncharacterized protein (TIGR02597 family)